MRAYLKEIFKSGNKRQRFKAIFVKFGKRYYKHHEIRTILLEKVVNNKNQLVAGDKFYEEDPGHLWIDCGKQFDELGLVSGDCVEFFARVKQYSKGYLGFDEYGEKGFPQTDYNLCYPSKVKKISEFTIRNRETTSITEKPKQEIDNAILCSACGNKIEKPKWKGLFPYHQLCLKKAKNL